MAESMRPTMFILTAGLLVASLLIAAIAVAVFVPTLPCLDCPPRQDFQPCTYCNGFGRTPLLQRWYQLQYQRQQERNFREMQM